MKNQPNAAFSSAYHRNLTSMSHIQPDLITYLLLLPFFFFALILRTHLHLIPNIPQVPV